MKVLKSLERRFFRWLILKIDQYGNELGFEQIYYNGSPVKIEPVAPDGLFFLGGELEVEEKIVKGYDKS